MVLSRSKASNGMVVCTDVGGLLLSFGVRETVKSPDWVTSITSR